MLLSGRACGHSRDNGFFLACAHLRFYALWRDARKVIYEERRPRRVRRRATAADRSVAMSLRVDASVATRLAEHETRGGPAGARGWLVGPADRAPGDAVVIGTLCRQAESEVGEDLRRASAVLPGGLEVVGAYVSGDKADAERLVAETKPHLEGSFLVAAVSQGVASYFQRFSTSDAAVSTNAEPLEKGWLEREYATFRCEMRVPIGATNSAGSDAGVRQPRGGAAEPGVRRGRRRRRRRDFGRRGDEKRAGPRSKRAATDQTQRRR
jgi:hypothetical protein